MKTIDWNISYNNAPEPKIDLLKSVIGDDSFIVILQEVTPSQYQLFKQHFANIRYSLDYRKPGKYDSRQRELGVAIIASTGIEMIDAHALERCLLPDRTLLVDFKRKIRYYVLWDSIQLPVLLIKKQSRCSFFHGLKL